MRLWVLVLVGCGFHSHPATGDGSVTDGTDAPAIDSSRDGVPAVSSPRRLVITSTAGMALSNFRVYVSLDATSIDYATVADPTTDLRFHDDVANVDRQFEIDHWNPAGESGVWVKLDLPQGMLTSTLMYFGPTANGTAKPDQVWGAFDLVQHMQPSYVNSVGINYNGSALGTGTGSGQLGDALTFSGSGDEQLDFAAGGQLFDGWSAFALDFWIYPDYAAVTDLDGEPLFMGKGVSLDAGRMIDDSGTPELQIDLHFSNSNDIYMPIPVPLRQWSYVAYTFDGQHVHTFVNGAQHDAQSLSGGPGQVMLTDSEAFYLGDPANPFKGAIDELRIEQGIARSPDWIMQQYRSMTRQMVTFTDP